MLCTKCGSDKMIPKAVLWDQGQSSNQRLNVIVERHPEALLFRGTTMSQLYAHVCGECGFTEIFADNPQELYRAYLESNPDR